MKASLEKIDFQSNSEIDMIHKALYCFSNTSLHNLMRKSEALRFIISDSLKKKDEIFNLEENSDEKMHRDEDIIGFIRNSKSSNEDIKKGLIFMSKLNEHYGSLI